MAIKTNDCNYPEMDYFMNESVSDVVFVIDGQRIPAIKSILSCKSRVFRAMFCENFKESKEVVIEDTTFDAFKTLIQFLCCDQLVLKDNNDLKLIEEVYKLSEKYQVMRLSDKICQHLDSIPFEVKFENIELISRIADNSKNKELIENVKTFIDNNLDNILEKDSKQLAQLNDSTHNYFLEVVSKKCVNLVKILGTCCRDHRCPHRVYEEYLLSSED